MGTALVAMAGRQALREQEQKLEAIVAGTTDAILQVGPTAGCAGSIPPPSGYWVSRRRTALGHTCREVLGCGPHRGCAGVCPFSQVLTTREPIPNVELVVGEQGQPRHVAASVATLDLGADTAPGGGGDPARCEQAEAGRADEGRLSHHRLAPVTHAAGPAARLHRHAAPPGTVAAGAAAPASAASPRRRPGWSTWSTDPRCDPHRGGADGVAPRAGAPGGRGADGDHGRCRTPPTARGSGSNWRPTCRCSTPTRNGWNRC